MLARDPFQDLAILKIEREKEINEQGNLTQFSFPVIELGDSDNLQIGQTVIAIGNALGEFKNTVSVGVVSGLDRTITASGAGIVEVIEGVIQTDAAINQGNSGGPLIDLKGRVVGINTATVLEAQSIGFTIPVNKAKRDIEQVKKTGQIIYPFLGIRYRMITPEIKEENDLPADDGAWISGDGEPGVVPDSAADKAGLQEGDIILEFNGEKLTAENSLAEVIQKYSPGDRVSLKVLRDGDEIGEFFLRQESTPDYQLFLEKPNGSPTSAKGEEANFEEYQDQPDYEHVFIPPISSRKDPPAQPL